MRRNQGEGTIYSEVRHRQVGYVAEKRFTLPNGKKVRVKARGLSEKDAWTRLEEKLNEAKKRSYQPKIKRPTAPIERKSIKRRKNSVPKRDWTFQEFALHYYANKANASQEVKDKEVRTLELHVFDHIGQIEIRSVTKTVVGRYWAELKNGQKSQLTGVHNNVWKILSKVLNYALNIGIINENPLKTVDRGKTKKKDRQVEIAIKIRFINRILLWMDNTKWYKEHPLEFAMLRLNCLGLRTAELCGIGVKNWLNQDVGLIIDQQFARVTQGHKSKLQIKKSTKTGQVRRLPLPPETEKALENYWENRRNIQVKDKQFNDLFFIDLETRKPIEPNAYREMLTNIVEHFFYNIDCANMRLEYHSTYLSECKVKDVKPLEFDQWLKMQYNQNAPNITPKDLRTVAVTKLLDSGANQELVTALIGNSAAVREKHYYYSQLQAQLQALEAVEQNKGDEKEKKRLNIAQQIAQKWS